MSTSWESVRSFGNSTIVKSNYIWLFIIPFLTKNIEKITAHLHLEIEITFNVSRLFYASLCFVVGTIIYQLRCPKLIKDHDGYADFEEKGKTVQHIVEYCQAEQRQPFSEFKFEDIKKYLSTFDINTDENSKLLVSICSPKGITECSYIDSNLDKNLFWDTYNKLNGFNNIAAGVCFAAYLTGCFFLLIVSIENTLYALKYFLF